MGPALGLLLSILASHTCTLYPLFSHVQHRNKINAV